MYGHLSTSRFTDDYPQFFARGEGARVWDVDGREFVDLMCTFGPILLGHAHPEVDAIHAETAARGDVLNGPGPEMVELAELLVDQVPHADWAMFAKNGTDATGLAVTTARAATGRSKILMARNSYHGIEAWALPPEAPGTTAEEHLNTIFFDYNDLDSVEAAAIEAGDGTVAAIVCTPHRHDVFTDQVAVDPEFARGVREICDRLGAALILDDVRCGLRMDLRGSWEAVGVRPDLSAWSKSLANGYALAVLLGAEPYREAAGKIVATGSFWLAGAPMAAALATIRILKETDGIATMRDSGVRLQEGLRAQAAAHGFAVSVSGPPSMPLLLFGDDPEFAKGLAWAGHCAHHGVYLHPVHNWFLSTAHDAAVIDAALERTDLAFADLRAGLGGT
ncbi:MAG TPA: aminotransferase class III-fold pyridoxal phosphate-dependent enzyme [Baekduia sp.]|nr:aminotransferase class III-fold pyridoxal phosphate-dependent enzyme [Baekduia sp.]